MMRLPAFERERPRLLHVEEVAVEGNDGEIVLYGGGGYSDVVVAEA